MISEDEWSLMKSNFTVDKEISVSRNKTDNAEFFATEPPVCDECLEKRCREEEEEQLIYRWFKVHIFWEGHKILQKLHLTFDWHYIGQK